MKEQVNFGGLFSVICGVLSMTTSLWCLELGYIDLAGMAQIFFLSFVVMFIGVAMSNAAMPKKR